MIIPASIAEQQNSERFLKEKLDILLKYQVSGDLKMVDRIAERFEEENVFSSLTNTNETEIVRMMNEKIEKFNDSWSNDLKRFWKDCRFCPSLRHFDDSKEKEEELKALRRNLELWYHKVNPRLHDDLIDFIRISVTDLGTLEWISSKKLDFKKKILRTKIIEDFSTLYERTVDIEIERLIQAELANRNFEDENRRQGVENFLRSETGNLNAQLVYSDSKMQDLREKIDKFESCMSSFQDRIEEALENTTEPKTVTAHLKRNKCAAQEICVKNPEITDLDLKIKLAPYIKMINQPRADPFAKNVQNELNIDDAIYDLIQTHVLLVLKVNKQKSECFVDFLKRSQEFIEIYSPEAIFDESHDMWTRIKQLMDNYEKIYSIKMKSTA